MDYFNAFWVGGLICALVQILLDKTKLLPGRVMVLLVCSGAVLSFLGFYQPFIEYAGAGASVPLLGFGNILWKGMKKAIDENGFLGLFTGGFTACAVGVSAALIFSYLASLIFHPRMKNINSPFVCHQRTSVNYSIAFSVLFVYNVPCYHFTTLKE